MDRALRRKISILVAAIGILAVLLAIKLFAMYEATPHCPDPPKECRLYYVGK